MAWVAKERRQSQREQQIAEQLTEAGAAILFGGPYDHPDVSEDEQSWWRRLLKYFLGPRVARVIQETISAEVPTPSTGGKNAQERVLSKIEFGDLERLASLRSLRYLYLNSSQVHDLTPLAGLTNQESLSASRPHVNDLTPLFGLKNLRNFNFTQTQVSDEQVGLLKRTLSN